MTETREIDHKEWVAEAKRRFGDDAMAWRFKCPSCGYVASLGDWKAAGAGEGEWAFSCIGRRIGAKREFLGKGKGPGPCNYAGGGLFRINPVRVKQGDEVRDTFEFAEGDT